LINYNLIYNVEIKIELKNNEKKMYESDFIFFKKLKWNILNTT